MKTRKVYKTLARILLNILVFIFSVMFTWYLAVALLYLSPISSFALVLPLFLGGVFSFFLYKRKGRKTVALSFFLGAILSISLMLYLLISMSSHMEEWDKMEGRNRTLHYSNYHKPGA